MPLLVLVGSAPFATHDAAAQPAPKTASASDDARARFEEGVKLAEAGDHERARLKFVQAWALLKYPAVLFNLARSEQLSGRLVDAAKHFREFLQYEDASIQPQQRKLASSFAVEIAQEIGQLAIEAPRGTAVTIDGAAIAEADLGAPVAVTPGQHTVRARTNGAEPKTVEVLVERGEVKNVSFAEAAPPPGASAPVPVAPPSVRVDEHPSHAARNVVASALGVAGLAGVGLGIGFGLASNHSNDLARSRGIPLVCVDKSSPACRDYTDAHDRAETQAKVAWIGYISGGVLLAGALGTLLLWPASHGKASSGLRLVPVAAPSTAGAMFSGSF